MAELAASGPSILLPPASILQAARIPYRRLGASALFAAYAGEDARALAYYAHDPWDAAARAEAARRAAAAPADRDVLADVLLEQNAAWWGEEEAGVRAGVERLRDAACVAVVTGQQLGLFGGPLYTVYKALTAVRLARQLEAETGRPVVPVFWLADEDHDFAEVRATTLLGRVAPVRVAYDDGLAPDANRGPVGRLALGTAIAAALDAVAAALPPTPFAAALAGALRADWRPGARWRDAFARTLRRLTAGAGLVFVSGDDARLKRLAVPLFHEEVEGWAATHEALLAVSARLQADGFHAQVAPRPVNLFLFHGGQRLPLDPAEGGFALRGADVRFTSADLRTLLEVEPERFSPGVALRPVMQDRLFPTAAYVGGPGEVAYFAQLGPVYARFGVPMPVVYPRASLTLLPEKTARVLGRYGLTVADLAGAHGASQEQTLAALHRRLALEHAGVDLDAPFAAASAALDALLDGLRPLATGVDASLDRAVEAARAKARRALRALEQKTARAAKRKHAVIYERLGRAAVVLFPGGAPQERVLSPLAFLAAEGPDLPRRLLDVLDLDTRAHDVLMTA
jgi:bacillithiol biosynthesis cysteine-adding enzyme BshC